MGHTEWAWKREGYRFSPCQDAEKKLPREGQFDLKGVYSKKFFFLFGLGNFYSSSSLLIYLTVSSNLLLIFSSVFFIQLLFVPLYCLSLCYTSHHVHWASLWLLSWILYLLRLLISISPSSSRILFYSLVWNLFLCSSFCLILCVYFYVLGRLVTFSILGELSLCRRPMGPSSTLPSGHQNWML